MSFEIKKIHDPKFFKENCMAAYSDHVAYADETEAEEKKSSFRLSLEDRKSTRLNSSHRT